MFHIDNLSASIIGAIVLFIVLFMQQRQQDVAVEKVAAYAANMHSIELGTWLQEDMTNIGWMTPPSNTGIVSIAANDSIPSLTKSFVFDGYDPSADTVSTRITYRLVPALKNGAQNFVEVNGSSVPVWELQRVINGNVTGSSPSLMTHFSVEMLTEGGTAATTTSARKLRISFSMALPYVDGYIQEVHWGSMFSIWRL